MIIGSILYFASIDVNRLTEIVINCTSLQYVDKVKNLGVTITSKLLNGSFTWAKYRRWSMEPWGLLISTVNHSHSNWRKNLIQTLVMPHFDYASVVYNHLDKTRGTCLQVAHNACIRFITGYVPFIPSRDVKSHVTHCRFKLGWLSLASRRFLKLLDLFYRLASTKPYETRAPCPI